MNEKVAMISSVHGANSLPQCYPSISRAIINSSGSNMNHSGKVIGCLSLAIEIIFCFKGKDAGAVTHP